MATYKQDHTHVTTPEPEALAEFYTNVMGAKIIKHGGNTDNPMIDVDLGGIPLRISKGTGADKDWQGLRYGLHHLALAVDDLDEFIDDMKTRGVEIITEPFEPRAQGPKIAFIKGPDGVLFELLEKKGD